MGQTIAALVGRGHGGTRAGASWLRAAGFDIGDTNPSLDRKPFDPIYDAGRMTMQAVRHLGGDRWDLDALNTCPIPRPWIERWETYLHSVTRNGKSLVAWKLPETVLSYPWLVRAFPEVRFVVWHRDPRNAVTGFHITDNMAEWGLCNWPQRGVMQQRALSWLVQFHLLEGAVRPPHWARVRLRDFVAHQPAARRVVGRVVGVPMPSHPVRREVLDRWSGHDLQAAMPTIRPVLHHFREGAMHW